MPDDKKDLKLFYDQTAEILKRSYGIPFNAAAIKKLNTATHKLKNVMKLMFLCAGEKPKTPMEPERGLSIYFPEYAPGPDDPQNRFNLVISGKDQEIKKEYENLKNNILELARPIAEALRAIDKLDEETGGPRTIRDVMPAEYVKALHLDEYPDNCETCGKPITKDEVFMCDAFPITAGHRFCDEHRIEFFKEQLEKRNNPQTSRNKAKT